MRLKTDQEQVANRPTSLKVLAILAGLLLFFGVFLLFSLLLYLFGFDFTWSQDIRPESRLIAGFSLLGAGFPLTFFIRRHDAKRYSKEQSGKKLRDY